MRLLFSSGLAGSLRRAAGSEGAQSAAGRVDLPLFTRSDSVILTPARSATLHASSAVLALLDYVVGSTLSWVQSAAARSTRRLAATQSDSACRPDGHRLTRARTRRLLLFM